MWWRKVVKSLEFHTKRRPFWIVAVHCRSQGRNTLESADLYLHCGISVLILLISFILRDFSTFYCPHSHFLLRSKRAHCLSFRLLFHRFFGYYSLREWPNLQGCLRRSKKNWQSLTSLYLFPKSDTIPYIYFQVFRYRWM